MGKRAREPFAFVYKGSFSSDFVRSFDLENGTASSTAAADPGTEDRQDLLLLLNKSIEYLEETDYTTDEVIMYLIQELKKLTS